MQDQVAQLYLGSNTLEPLCSPLGRGEVAVFSQPCPTIENRENEDSAAVIVISPTTWVLAVADGVGGIPGGRQASARALEVFARRVQRIEETTSLLREAILDGFDEANRAVLALGTGGCTTLAVAAIERDRIRCYHVGDSAVLVVGQRGRLKHLTVAHSPVGYAIESGMLDEADAMNHADRHLVSNVLGSDQMKIEIGPKITLAARDTVAIASDGVLDNISIDQFSTLVRNGPIAKAARELAKTTLDRMRQTEEPNKPDDTTFVIYRPQRSGRGTKQGERSA
ncbi:MAG: protein phosphatase 2C domain-containing protein [Planctomycetes bacterium]|nr:protein phosphatase 2C domain-containing protein [Planctomycetota bacterium]